MLLSTVLLSQSYVMSVYIMSEDSDTAILSHHRIPLVVICSPSLLASGRQLLILLCNLIIHIILVFTSIYLLFFLTVFLPHLQSVRDYS